MSFLKSYEAFKANGGMFDTKRYQRLIANFSDEPWEMTLEKLIYFHGQGGKSVPPAYAGAYQTEEFGNCFTYATGKAIKLPNHPLFILDNTIDYLKSPSFYGLHGHDFGEQSIIITEENKKNLRVEQKAKNTAIIGDIVNKSNLAKDIPHEQVSNYIPLLYMVGYNKKSKTADYHFLLPHIVETSSATPKITTSFRLGTNDSVVLLPEISCIEAFYESYWQDTNYKLQPSLLFLEKQFFGQSIKPVYHSNLKAIQTITKKNHMIDCLADLDDVTIKKLNTLDFNFFINEIKDDKKSMRIT